jgi:hypothetical protein
MNCPKLVTSLFTAVLILGAPAAHGGARFTLFNQDDAGAGFNSDASPDRLSRLAGNPGETLGEQRLWVFRQAAQYWGRRLDSNVPIEVGIQMSDLNCTSTSATLGFAGPNLVFRDWSAGTSGVQPPRSNTWYVSALADRLADRDLDANDPDGTDANDITATFNAAIDDPDCLQDVKWYYGLDNAPPRRISFFDTVLHELGHGLGVLTFVDLQTGEKPTFVDGRPRDDAYMAFLEDTSKGERWPALDAQGRAESITDTGDTTWVGSSVRQAADSLSNGTTGDKVQVYAPSPIEPGSSISHWDTAVTTDRGNDELMEPFSTPNQAVRVTDELLADIGWNEFEGDCGWPDERTISGVRFTQSGVQRVACLLLRTQDDVTIEDNADVTFRSTDGANLGPGFSVEKGASFEVEIDPLLTLR